MTARYTLAPGETASVEDTGIGVRFAGVLSDSRCPMDVNCIHAGSAQVRITVIRGQTRRDHELQTGGTPVRHDDLTIALLNLGALSAQHARHRSARLSGDPPRHAVDGPVKPDLDTGASQRSNGQV